MEDGGERAAVSLTCFYGPFRSLCIGGRISLQQLEDSRRCFLDGWMIPSPSPAALFDATELMEEAERLDGRTDAPAKVAGAEISAKRPTEVRWFVHSGNYEFMM